MGTDEVVEKKLKKFLSDACNNFWRAPRDIFDGIYRRIFYYLTGLAYKISEGNSAESKQNFGRIFMRSFRKLNIWGKL